MKKILAGLFILPILCAIGCDNACVDDNIYTAESSIDTVHIYDELVALADAPAPKTENKDTVARGLKTKRNSNAVIDYSNVEDGYVMLQYTAKTDSKLKAQVKGNNVTYTYNLNAEEWVTLPFSEGNGDYTVALYRNVSGTKYASVISLKLSVTMKDEFTAFLHPNQYVNYSQAPKTVAKAAELTEGIESPLEKVAAIYDFTVNTLTYDYDKAATVKSGYLPVLDTVLDEKKGICFDYAALMTAMLRSQGIPCKLVVGYAGKSYHAWISVWSETDGWIDGAIWFNGTSWQRMDPTFASSGKKSASIMKYIGDGKNYTAKYLY